MVNRTEYHAYILILASVTLWCAALFVPPLIAHLESPSHEVSGISYRCFSPICHQFESRSLALFGHKLAVCARCSGIYFGALAGILIFPLVRSRKTSSTRMIWFIVSFPMLTDVSLDFFGLHGSSIFTRLFTGAVFGIGGSWILLPIAIEAVRNIKSDPSQQQGVKYESEAR